MMNARYLRRRNLRSHSVLVTGIVWRREPAGVVVEVVDGLPSARLAVTIDDRHWPLALDAAGCGRLEIDVDDRAHPIEIRHDDQLLLTGHLPTPPANRLVEENAR